ncbi:GNAT family N-acetyltransferase [Pseudactinotalea sp. Z1739]|uniref:GNAT family N-acetyltransferase n=1 Tax=Pseudactinotalea sp. Z1739 TaxID=3413028 RepID=UPI003C7BB9BB
MTAHSHGPTADVSVRPAIAEDADHLGRIQLDSWRARHRDHLPEQVLAGLDATDFAAAWRSAITDPPSPKHRVLTATAGPLVVGFAALAPGIDGDPTGEVVELAVDTDHLRQGHGSRLLAACTDVLKGTGAAKTRIWLVDGDEVREAFLTDAGFGPVGVRRVLQVGQAQVSEHAWAADLHG